MTCLGQLTNYSVLQVNIRALFHRPILNLMCVCQFMSEIFQPIGITLIRTLYLMRVKSSIPGRSGSVGWSVILYTVSSRSRVQFPVKPHI